VLIASTAHEWAERTSVYCSEIASIPLLMRERGSGTRHVIELALERQDVKRNSLHIVMGTRFDRSHQIRRGSWAGGRIRLPLGNAKDLRLGNNFKIVEIEG